MKSKSKCEEKSAQDFLYKNSYYNIDKYNYDCKKYN